MLDKLSRRERQILDILFRRGKASASDVQSELPESPSYSAVRALLRILEEKGHIRHDDEGGKYIYSPVISRAKARQLALKSMMETFFDGSASSVVAALVDGEAEKLSREELDRLSKIIERARKDVS